MKILYSIAIFLYASAINFFALFNAKAKLRHDGAKRTFTKLEQFKSDNVIWVHCASLGEFEQGRPLIEKIKQKFPNYQIALSFFSPSGYEMRKNYELADIVFYLPNDYRKNAEKLVSLLKPKFVFYVKYEFWYRYLNELYKTGIPVFLISGIFRKNQIFFKFYGRFFKNILQNFTHLFVQNQSSEELLFRHGITNVTITGDTRFDRVFEIAQNRTKIEIIEKFTEKSVIFIAGSTWKPDEEIIFRFINSSDTLNVKYIIVPHEIKDTNIRRIQTLCHKNSLLYSKSNFENINDADVLIIDNVGMLSSLYAYADIAFIGGGFGSGIHNTLEAAVYGIPVIFGPHYSKFDEAKELINRKAGFSISDKSEFFNILQKLISDSEYRIKCGKNAEFYVNENIGATDKIIAAIDL